jgi:hypothetical protein
MSELIDILLKLILAHQHVAFVALLSAETFWTFVREFSPLSPFISQNSSSTLSVFSGVAE